MLELLDADRSTDRQDIHGENNRFIFATVHCEHARKEYKSVNVIKTFT
jgi:hypothetical protein